MKLLILGGTVFLGRHLVEAALARDHEVTLFNRGEQNPELFPDVEKLRGDRDGGLSPLEDRQWDAVIDTCGYVPRIVRQSAELLRDQVGHYTFISTISVYSDLSQPIDEECPLATMEDEGVEEVTDKTYGPLKVLCERAVLDNLPDRALLLRPGLIVGPHDPSYRFTYWPDRISRGGEVLVPGPASRTIQFIDVRDLADWNIRLAERRVTGTLNAVGTDPPTTMGSLFETCVTVSDSDASPVWVDDAFLQDNEVGSWMELPLWIPDTPENYGFYRTSLEKPQRAGLRFRPLETTVRDTLEWVSQFPEGKKPGQDRAGMKSDREKELIAKWKARNAT